MSELKGFRISDQDKWNKFVSHHPEQSRTIFDFCIHHEVEV